MDELSIDIKVDRKGINRKGQYRTQYEVSIA